MGSSWQTTCDAILADILVEVPGLRGVIPHRYSPYDPEEQIADGVERHIAVYPVGSSPSTAEPNITGPRGDLLTESYRIVYWEAAQGESSSGISDEDAAAALLELAEDVRDRFYVRENYAIGGTVDTRYIGTAFPERSGQVRWFAIGVTARRDITGT